MLDFFEVLWVYDSAIPRKKMIVCLDYNEGLFLRINTRDRIKPCVPIRKSDHPFLTHDSFVECSVCEFDEYVIEEGMSEYGDVIGSVSLEVAPVIREHLRRATYLSDALKLVVEKAFEQGLK